jgi:aminopeptidase YwaD
MDLLNADAKLTDRILNEIDSERMMDTVEHLARYHRYSWSEDAQKAVAFIRKRLEEYEIENYELEYEALFSYPRESIVQNLTEKKSFTAMPCVYSGMAQNLEGELYFDNLPTGPINENDNMRRFEAFRGKIILTRSEDTTFVRRAREAGALAILYIWPTGEDYLHHFLLGACIWGTPTPDNFHELAFLPTLTIRKNDGEKLIESLSQKKTIVLSINADVENKVGKSSMPMAVIPGKTKNYVLISGHYDSWYEGATDNATANAIMLELARVFNLHKAELSRGIRVIWWSGHSDARYSGST